MADGDAPAARILTPAEKTSDTISQLVARVLNQLSLSAWLPAAALVLLVSFVVQVGAALDAAQGELRQSPISAAVGSIAEISLGGAFLLIVAIVVLTMVTQAFSFEAIQLLEGYWANRFVQRLARWRCDRHRNVSNRLRERRDRLTRLAWSDLYDQIRRENQERRHRGETDAIRPEVLHIAKALVLKEEPATTPGSEDLVDAKQLAEDWPRYAPPDLIRQRTAVLHQLADYPNANRIMPTKLGNVLRHHEDRTDLPDVRTFVQRIFDELPISMKVDHDEMRTRLDLYCSMVFVVGLSTIIAIVRFAPVDLAYAAGSALIGLLGMAMMYQAGIASARAYGGLLVVIAEHIRKIHSRETVRGSVATTG